jgi:hypothetical protein
MFRGLNASALRRTHGVKRNIRPTSASANKADLAREPRERWHTQNLTCDSTCEFIPCVQVRACANLRSSSIFLHVFTLDRPVYWWFVPKYAR